MRAPVLKRDSVCWCAWVRVCERELECVGARECVCVKEREGDGRRLTNYGATPNGKNLSRYQTLGKCVRTFEAAATTTMMMIIFFEWTKPNMTRSEKPSAYLFLLKNFNGFETLTKTSFELVLMKQLREDTWFFGVRMLLDNSKFFWHWNESQQCLMAFFKPQGSSVAFYWVMGHGWTEG